MPMTASNRFSVAWDTRLGERQAVLDIFNRLVKTPLEDNAIMLYKQVVSGSVVGGFPTTGGALPNVIPVYGDDIEGGAVYLGWLGLSYFRIWVIPRVLAAQNPSIGTGIPFHIWNAYSRPNELEQILGENDTGLEFNFEEGNVWRGIEFREVEITITPQAPIQIEADFQFVFANGVGEFRFEAVIADFVQMRPDPPVTEIWEWFTDIIIGHNGTEQRIALRETPRRSTSYEIGLENEADRRQQYNRWFTSLASRLIFPYYQYATRVTEPQEIGDSVLVFNPATTDIRDGEFVVVLSEATETGGLARVDTVTSTGATLESPLQFPVTRGSIVAPAFASRIEDRSGFVMFNVHGTLKVEAQVLDVRPQFSRPGSSAVIEQFDGLPVLTERPVSTTGPSSEDFYVDYEVIDSDTGLLDIKSSWSHPRVIMQRKFAVRRFQEATKMDWWRDFLDGARGMQNTFLMPTWFADLVKLEDPIPNGTNLSILSNNYAASYFPFETYRRLQIELEDGRIIYRLVLQAIEDEAPGIINLSLDQPFGENVEDTQIKKISFLNVCRLGSDRVTLIHDHQRTELQLVIQTTDDADELQ